MRPGPFIGVTVLLANSVFAQSAPSLGSAASFALLGRSSVTSTGTTHVTGNVGVSSGTTVTGVAVSLGDIHRDDALARQAQRDSAAAFAGLQRLPCTAFSFDGTPLVPGVYCFSAPLAGTVVLDANGDADAVWIFRTPGALVTADGSSVLLVDGAADRNVFWAVGGAATLGARSTFAGSIFAAAISLGEGARLSGRALARDGPIALRANEVSVCCSPIVVSAPPLPRGTAGVAYPPQTFSAAGGAGPYTFTQSGLPEGMSVTGGVLRGTPGVAGRFAFRVTAVDAQGCSGSAEFILDVDSCLTIEPAELPPASCPYEARIIARGCTPPYTFEVTAGALPPGIRLDPDGVLRGSAEATITATFTVTVTDARSISASRTYTLATAVCPCPIPFEPPVLLPAKECVPYSASFAGPYTFSVPQDLLPPGLVPGGANGATLSGIPSRRGRYSFPVTATDGEGTTCTRDYTIDVSCPELTISPGELPDGVAGEMYEQQLSSTPCVATFSVPEGQLPAGLVLEEASGRLSGVPAQTGSFTFTVTARSPSAECAGTRTYTIEIACEAIAVAPPHFENATVGVEYMAPLAISGGAEPYDVKVISGALPPSLHFTGATLTGVPAAAGTFKFGLRITDAAGCPGGEIEVCAFEVDPASCPAGTDIELTPERFPPAAPGVFYSQMISADGGTSPYTFAVTCGTLPDGLTLDPATGELSGVPTSTGTSRFTITVTDDNGCRKSLCVKLAVTATIPTASQTLLLALTLLLASLGVWRMHGE
jgi:large repetitive protein